MKLNCKNIFSSFAMRLRKIVSYMLLGSVCASYPAFAATASDTVCVVVKIRIEQQFAVERQGFDASLVLDNPSPAPMKDFVVNVIFQDEEGNVVKVSSDGNDSEALFFITPSSLTGIDDLGGNGQIQGKSSAEMHWLIIPSPGAARDFPQGKKYFVGAEIHYTQGGEPKTKAVGSDQIIVKATPELHLDYFLTQDVYGDDPMTPEKESSEPFYLGLLLHNTAVVPAKDIVINTRQPKIIDNTSNFPVNFKILGANLADRPHSASLRVQIPEIAAKSRETVTWTMLSTHAGEFTEIQATAHHAENLGGQLTAIIPAKEVKSHLLTGIVLNNGDANDDKLDFLANDGESGNPFYKLYGTDGEELDVLDASADAQLVYQSHDKKYIRYRLNLTKTLNRPAFIDLDAPEEIKRYSVIRAEGLPDHNVWLQQVRQARQSSSTSGTSSSFVRKLRLYDHNPKQSYDISVPINTHRPQAPVFVNGLAKYHRVKVNNTLNITFHAIDVNDDFIKIELSPSLPRQVLQVSKEQAGESIVEFSWRPSIEDIGEHSLVVSAFDGNQAATRHNFIIEVVKRDANDPNNPQDPDQIYPQDIILFDDFEED